MERTPMATALRTRCAARIHAIQPVCNMCRGALILAPDSSWEFVSGKIWRCKYGQK